MERQWRRHTSPEHLHCSLPTNQTCQHWSLRAKLLDRVDLLPQLEGFVATGGRLNVGSLLEQISAVNFTAERYVVPESVGINLIDETGFAADAVVSIETSSGDSETLTIDAAGSFEFATSIDAIEGTANADDGILQITSGDTLTVTYFDADLDSESGVIRSDTALIFVDNQWRRCCVRDYSRCAF